MKSLSLYGCHKILLLWSTVTFVFKQSSFGPLIEDTSLLADVETDVAMLHLPLLFSPPSVFSWPWSPWRQTCCSVHRSRDSMLQWDTRSSSSSLSVYHWILCSSEEQTVNTKKQRCCHLALTHTHTSHFKNKQTNRWSFYFSKWLNLVISQMIVQLLLHVLSSERHTTLCCAIFIQQKSSLSLFLRSLIWEMCELMIDLRFSKNLQLFSVALQWKWQNLLIPNLPCRGTVWEQFAFLFFS